MHTLTAEELLNGPTSAMDVEPAEEELLDTPIFDLNIAKLPPSTEDPSHACCHSRSYGNGHANNGFFETDA
uniref:Uncharacterized protein n=1 Tax=Romanomermis culicivorax TaxID=13658 RepID=A0A915JAW2_ROMCU